MGRNSMRLITPPMASRRRCMRKECRRRRKPRSSVAGWDDKLSGSRSHCEWNWEDGVWSNYSPASSLLSSTLGAPYRRVHYEPCGIAHGDCGKLMGDICAKPRSAGHKRNDKQVGKVVSIARSDLWEVLWKEPVICGSSSVCIEISFV